MSRRFQFSLRALLSCLVVLTMVVAKRRDGLRDWLESLWAGKPVNQIVIVGPVTLSPPSPDEIATALERAGKVNRVPKDFRMTIEPLSNYRDPPHWWSGDQWGHSHYKCELVGDEGTRTVYIDYKHLCVPSAK